MVEPPQIEVKGCVGIALLRTGNQIVYMSRLVITYVHGGRVLGIVCLVLDCQKAHG